MSYGQSEELDYDGQPKPLFEVFRETCLAIEQPVLDLGWRVDYERRGISRVGDFVPLADVQAAAKVFEGREPVKRDPNDPPPYRERQPGECFFTAEDLQSVVDAFELHDRWVSEGIKPAPKRKGD